MKGVPLFFMLFSFLLYPSGIKADTLTRKVLVSHFIAYAPTIDGDLSDSCWQAAESASHFTTTFPNIGKPSSFQSEVKFVYDKDAFYVAAYLFDPSPKHILTELSERDYWSSNSDKFSLELNPYDDGQNAFHFEVSAANVQKDIKISSTQWDGGWNAVWQSAVKITDKGWCVEMRIPYNQIRFPQKEKQTWAVNFFREVRRVSESSSWNLVDRTKGNQIAQAGYIQGVEGINMPFRLALYPYISGNYEKNPNGTSYAYSAGMDLKMGLSEGFTLDLMLVPDFGQRKSDYEVLNMSPFEVKYGESRQFFAEGTELFTKAGLFYSRRIGRKPGGYQTVKDEIKEGETLLENPDEAKLINATKISGRTTNGLGLGFLNAVTNNTYATKRLVDGKEIEVLTEPLSNYNLMVYDKTIGKYSYLNFTNTNLMRNEVGRFADALGTAFRFADRNNEFAFYGKISSSYIHDKSEKLNKSGGLVDLGVGKITGSFRYNYGVKYISNKYDPNDVGFLNRNNLLEQNIGVYYGVYEPHGAFLNWSTGLGLHQSNLAQPMKYASTSLDASYNATFVNFYSVGASINIVPFWEIDFFEPREWGRQVRSSPYSGFSIWSSSDGKKTISFSDGLSLFHGKQGDYYGFNYGANLRASEKLSFHQSSSLGYSKNNYGYVDKLNYDTIYFGKRDIPELTVSFSSSYVFNNKSSVSLDVRHNWTKVDYKSFWFLTPSGDYDSPGSYAPTDKDINFNTLNIDFVYLWNFAPGSSMTFMWKNKIYKEDVIVENKFSDYTDNLDYMLGLPQTNSFSFKVSYYLDYKYLTRLKKT